MHLRVSRSRLLRSGATREAATDYYFKEIEHYVYSGDTALHIAAAAYAREISKKLLSRGASAAREKPPRRRATSLCGRRRPGSHTWNPTAQEAIVECLIEAGADPNSADKSGVTPLHRAVRTRCAAAVRALLANGANPRLKNGSGSTSLHLAVQNTGRGGTGSSPRDSSSRRSSCCC